MTFDQIKLEDIKRLHLEPGDTLVLNVDFDLDPDEAAHLASQMRERFPGHETVVLSRGMKLEVVGS